MIGLDRVKVLIKRLFQFLIFFSISNLYGQLDTNSGFELNNKQQFESYLSHQSCNFEFYRENSDSVFFIKIDTNECELFIKAAKYDIFKNRVVLLYSQDTLRILEVNNYLDGKLNGENIKYFNNGNIKSKAVYSNDKLWGRYDDYYKNGTIRSHGEYVDGKLVGSFLCYREDAKIETVGSWEGGIMESTSIIYWNNNKVAKVTMANIVDGNYKEHILYFDPEGNSIDEAWFNRMWYGK